MKIVKKKTSKTVIITIIFFILIWIIGIYMFNIFNNKKIISSNYKTEKLESTINKENVEKTEGNPPKLEDVLEEVTKSVVGISKLKNTGGSIFSSSDEGKLGLGTGIIVGENGYILSNEHLTGEKYSKCYVTLFDGRDYNRKCCME